MPKVAKELGPLDVRRLVHTGAKGSAFFAVGGVAGLYLQITPKGGRSWVLRTVVGMKRTDIGLGGYPTVTLAQAREKAREARDKLERGIDPVAERRAAKQRLIAARRKGMTFEDAMEKALAAKLDAFKNEKHRDQWRNTLVQYAIPVIGSLSLQEIDTAAVLRVLSQEVRDKAGELEGTLWQARTETASRLRGRIEAVLSWATVAGERSGDNPARWAGNLKELLPAASKIAVEGNQPALALDDAGRWFADLNRRDGFGARALEFVAMTAARSGEVRGATWDEIDLQKGLWVVPAARMKMKREHRIPLPTNAVAMLEALPRLDGNPLVFPAARGGMLSDMTLSATMRRMHEADLAAGGVGFFDRRSKRPAVPHGLRSTFRDWVAERTTYPSDMAEVALAHQISNAVEAAYRRGDMVEKRRGMMADWAAFLRGSERKAAKILRLK
jgi:integrase